VREELNKLRRRNRFAPRRVGAVDEERAADGPPAGAAREPR
jgi:hypothetical protein